MRYRRLFPVLFFAGISACAPVAEEAPAAVARAALQSSCGGTHWVGVDPGCQDHTGWTVTQLFPGAPAPLSDLCAYARNPFDRPDELTGIDDLGEDCPVAVPQALASFDAAVAGSLRGSLRAQVGTVDTVGLKPPGEDATPVRVVVVDTAPDALLTAPIVPGLDRHGDTLAGLISDIACGSAGCTADVDTALGLPWLDKVTWTPEGGHVGRLSDVAKAIWRAFQAAEGARERLILNLSLGWEDAPGFADCVDDPAAMMPPARAVFQILQHLACQGVLVVAAAGNDAGGPEPPRGMVCPARWEAQPLGATCGVPADTPMVHAVGGVDYAGRPIVVTRPRGRPRLAATALGGVGWAGSAAPPPLTGTSVAAAVVSGVSAAVWAQRPALSGAQVISALYESGLPVGPADVCPAGQPSGCEAHRVSLCNAVLHVGVGLDCAAAPDQPTSTPSLDPAALAALSLTLASLPANASVVAAPVSDPSLLPRWSAPGPALSGAAFPQPVVPVCPSCTFSLSSMLYAPLTSPLDQPTLVVESGSTLLAAPLCSSSTLAASACQSGSSTLAAGAYRITVSSAPATRAWITGQAPGGASVTQEILIVP